MNKLTVLYDDHCGFCRRCRVWLSSQSTFVPLEFVAWSSSIVGERFPTLGPSDTPEELIVISDEGGVYRRSSAYIMCLWALEEYRELALSISGPHLLPLATKVFRFVSTHRGGLSRFFGRRRIERGLEDYSDRARRSGECTTSACPRG